jgi:serine/threonine protein kinase
VSDAKAFLDTYRDTLRQEVGHGGWPPELLAVYEPESCLKHSGTREVYLVTDRRTGGKAILRATDPEDDLETSAQAGSDAEYQILSKLNFPGIPKTYGTFAKDGRTYLAREYFDGQPLDQVIARGTMQSPQIYAFTRQLCAILEYLHAQNPPVIHRDIKPQNIIVRTDGSIGLTDFGIARIYKEGSSSDTSFAGTTHYAPPEQYGFAQSSGQTDIYALGIVLIYLATGSPNRQNLTRRIPDVSLRKLIEKCIALDPKDRFQNVRQVVRRIDAIKTRKPRLAAGIVTAALALALIGMGAYAGVNALLDSLSGSPASAQDNPSSHLPTVSDTTVPDYPNGVDPLTYENPLVTKNEGETMLYDYENDGNLDGNLNGECLAVGDGTRFFVIDDDVPNDFSGEEPDYLYQIDKEGALPEKLYESRWLDSLNIYDGALYFGCLEGIMRYDIDKKEMSLLIDAFVHRMFFDNGKLYYLQIEDEGCTLRTIGTDGRGGRQVIDHTLPLTDAWYSFCDGVFYYTAPEEGFRLYACDLGTGTETMILDRRVEEFSVCNGNVYFIDRGADGRPQRMNLASGTVTELSSSAYYQLNATPLGLFAVNRVGLNATRDPSMTDTEDFRLEVMDGNGDNVRIIHRGYVGEYCLANGWIFYFSTYDRFALRMMRLDGTDDQRFYPDVALPVAAE